MRQGFERLLVGRTLAGRYEVLEPIGSGGMSVVFRARDRTLGREVALKAISLAAASDTQLSNLRERFRREAGSAARIQHPNVVQVHDYGTDPELELDFLVMELLRGHDLKEALRQGPPPPREALRILVDAARGIAAGHRAGIVHRDVKPANVFLSDQGGVVESVHILDFGIAKPLEDDPELALTTIGHLPHSPAYASPEQLDPDAPVTAASDVYQLGLIGYEMLAGRRPWNEEERARVRAGEDLPLPRTEAWGAVPPAVCQVLERALRPRAADRYPDAAAFAEALAGAAEAPAVVAEPVPAPIPDADATALLTATAAIPAAAPPSPSLPPPGRESVAMRAPAPRRPLIARTPVVWVLPLLLLIGIAAWLAASSGDGDRPAAVQADTTSPDVAALEDEFLRLEASVAGQGASAASPAPARPTTSTPPARTAVTTGAAPGEEMDFVVQASNEIEAAVTDLNQAWVQGQISRHVGHYASRVDYYNSNNLSRAGVRRDRTRDLRRYSQRQIVLHSVDIRFEAPDRARVLVDKEWHFGGDGAQRNGRGIQEYIFKRDDDDGRWYVISEQLLERNESNRRSEDG